MIEENQVIETQNPVFANYLDVLSEMLAGRSNNLYLRSALSELAETSKLNCVFDEVTPVRVSDYDTASMFRMNIETWQYNPFILDNYSQSELSALMAALDKIVDSEHQNSSITFNVRQLAFERR